MSKLKFGFTLAEVLITLGIIGVVAALTMPNLIVHYKEKAAATKLKKVYTTLSNAYALARNEETDVRNWFNDNNSEEDNHKILFEHFKPFLKISKECGTESGCWSKGYLKKLTGNNYWVEYDKSKEYRIILSDGTHVIFYKYPPRDNASGIGNIKIDIDGFKGKHTFGKDVFVFNITSERILPAGTQNGTDETFEEYCNRLSTASSNGSGCAAWVIYNENMDYLHCDDLSWNGKHECK